MGELVARGEVRFDATRLFRVNAYINLLVSWVEVI